MVKNRNYGIDVLRIISMLMVVTLHILGHGGIIGTLSQSSVAYKVIWLLEIACYCAVNCYVLISGDVNINTRYKYSNIIILWLQVLFYSITITLFMIILNNDILFQSVFPLFTNQYWFFTSYFGLFLFIPIINKAIQTIDKKKLEKIIYLLVITISLFPTLFQNDIFGTKNGYSTIWFIVLYIIGGYIGKYKLHKSKNYIYLIGYGLCVFITWLSKMVIERYSLLENSNLLVNYTSPTILMAGIFLVVFFSNYQFDSSFKKIISFFSSTSFGVYLIHEHPLIRSLIIKNRFVEYVALPIYKLLLIIFVSVILIYIICSIGDYIRLYCFNKLKIKNRIRTIELKVLKTEKQ